MASNPRQKIARTAAAKLATAACFFDAAYETIPGQTGRVLMQVTPAQDFKPSDGREMDVPAWRINAQTAQSVIDAFPSDQKLVIDYEHATLRAKETGAPAPAAGWMESLRWIDGRGLFAVVELTQRARDMVAANEYRYFSPVFEYERATGNVKRVLMGALTNDPAIHGMQAIDLTAAASARFSAPATDLKENDVTLLEKLIAALGLPAGTTEEVALAACTARTAQAGAAVAALKLKPDAAADAVTAACSAVLAPAVPDPAKFVPVEALASLQTSVAALTAEANARAVDDLVKPALADGRLIPAMEKWARDLGASNMAALSSYLQTAQPIAALSSTQTGGKPPQDDGAKGLSAGELTVAAACGMTPEQFATGRA